MKKLLPIFASATLLAACGSPKPTPLAGDLYPPEYTSVTGLPFNLELNSHAIHEMVDSQKEYRTFSIAYPEYGAEGRISIVMVDSTRLIPTFSRHLVIMELRADSVRDIDEVRRNRGKITRWVFTHPGGKEQLQWLATDSLTMYVAGSIHFEAANDSTVDITPALNNIKADVLHLVDNLYPEEK